MTRDLVATLRTRIIACRQMPMLLTAEEEAELHAQSITLIESLARRVEELEAVARKVEWVDEWLGSGRFCPICCNYAHAGHAPDCILAAALNPTEKRG